MVVGVLQLRLVLRESRSLKDKRRIVRSLRDRLRRSFNVSVAEVDSLDMLQSAVLAVGQVSSDSRYVRGALQQALNVVRGCRQVQIADFSIELVHQ